MTLEEIRNYIVEDEWHAFIGLFRLPISGPGLRDHRSGSSHYTVLRSVACTAPGSKDV